MRVFGLLSQICGCKGRDTTHSPLKLSPMFIYAPPSVMRLIRTHDEETTDGIETCLDSGRKGPSSAPLTVWLRMFESS